MSTEATKTEVGSYFISNYPPFSQWSVEALGEIEAAMAAPPKAVPLGLYLHIPFCRNRCKFCYFRVYTDMNAPAVETYVQALAHEIELVSRQPVMGGAALSLRLFRRWDALVSFRQTTHVTGRSTAAARQLGSGGGGDVRVRAGHAFGAENQDTQGTGRDKAEPGS